MAKKSKRIIKQNRNNYKLIEGEWYYKNNKGGWEKTKS